MTNLYLNVRKRDTKIKRTVVDGNGRHANGGSGCCRRYSDSETVVIEVPAITRPYRCVYFTGISFRSSFLSGIGTMISIVPLFNCAVA